MRIVVDLKSDGARYSPDVEQHVFRIVQEASMNALRHAKPTQITISGRLEKELIEIDIRDDGSGIESHKKLDLNALQAANHFGMSGIFERIDRGRYYDRIGARQRHMPSNLLEAGEGLIDFLVPKN